MNAGQLSIIKPNVAHTMVFTKDTTFLNLVRGERNHENYGITHTIKHIFVDEKEKNLLLECYKFDCRSCGNLNLKRVISLGYQPLANNLLKKENEKCDLYPLEVNYCDKCHNCQLSVSVDPKKMFENYLYTSSTSKVFRNHFVNAAKKYVIVKTNIIRDGTETLKIELDWRLIKRDGRTKIVDLSIEGISLIIAERETFISYLNNNDGNLASLIKMMQSKTN